MECDSRQVGMARGGAQGDCVRRPGRRRMGARGIARRTSPASRGLSEARPNWIAVSNFWGGGEPAVSPPVYYNDSEPFVCDWLENLIREKLLPAGVVDRRPIQEVEPADVRD